MSFAKAKYATAALLLGGAALLTTATTARADDAPRPCDAAIFCTKGPQLCATIEAGVPPLVITYYCYQPQGEF